MFFDNFQRICKEHGTKPTPVIVALGLSKGNIGRWKEGVIPSGDILLKIANYLNVSVDELLGAEKENPSSLPIGDDERSKLKAELFSLIDSMNDEELERFAQFERFISSSDEDYAKIKSVLDIMLSE